MASQWPPKKNTAFTLYFSLYKSDGTIIANPGTYTKKVSIDGAAVADITAAVTEEDTTYGQLSVVLAAGEMNGDAIWVYIKDDTAGCVPFTCTIYTAGSLHDEVKADTAAILADTGTDGVVLAADAITSAKIADNAITDAKINSGAITSAKFAAGAINAAAIAANAITDAKINDGALTAAKFAANSLTASALAADAGAEIAGAVWNEGLAGHSGAGSAGAALTAAGSAGDPWSATLPGAYGAGTAGKLVGDNLDAKVSTRASQASVDDVPTVAEFNARTLPSADYVVTSDTIAGVTTVGSVTGNVGGNVVGSVGSVGSGVTLTAGAIDAILDETIGDGTLTLRQLLRVMAAALAGKASGAGTTTMTFRSVADTTDVIVATVDADGNRSAVMLTV